MRKGGGTLTKETKSWDADNRFLLHDHRQQYPSFMSPTTTTKTADGCRLAGSKALAYRTLQAKARRNISGLVAQPTSWSSAPDGDYSKWDEHFLDIGNWTTSFITGMALIAWKETGDDAYLREVLKLEPLYRTKVGERAADTMHDLGFLYSLYSVALYQLTGEERHRELGLRAAGGVGGALCARRALHSGLGED